MNRRKLSSVIQVDTEDQIKPLLSQYCPNLTHIFLQENYLTFVGAPAFKNLKNIVQINLYKNMIVKMDCFDDCVKLQKLYLEHNQISKLEGLRNCTSLKELYIGN